MTTRTPATENGKRITWVTCLPTPAVLTWVTVYEADCPRTQHRTTPLDWTVLAKGGIVPPDAVRPISVRPLESTQGGSKMRRAQRARPDVVTEQCPVGAVINTCLTLNLAHGLNTLTGLGPSRRGGKRRTAETARRSVTLLRQHVTLQTPHC